MSVLTFVCCLEHYFLACLRYSSATFLFSALPQLHDESQSHRDVLKATSPSALSRNATTTTATTGSDRYAVFPPGDFNEAMAKARHMDSQDLSRDPNSGRKARLQNSTSTLGASTNSSRGRSPSRGGYYGAQMRNYSPSASSVASSDSRAGGGRSRVKQPWVGVTVDTAAPNAAAASEQQRQKRSRPRPRSASPGGQLTRRRAQPSPGQLQLRKRRSRVHSPVGGEDGSPAGSRSSIEITKGTFWGLYSEEEARRRKTDEYYNELARRTEEERRDIQERERNIAYVPPHRNVVSPGSLQRQKKGLRENLYRELRGHHE